MDGKDEQRRSHLKTSTANLAPKQHVPPTEQLTPGSRWPLVVVVPFSPSQQGCCVPSITGPSPASPHHRPGVDDVTLPSPPSEPTRGWEEPLSWAPGVQAGPPALHLHPPHSPSSCRPSGAAAVSAARVGTGAQTRQPCPRPGNDVAKVAPDGFVCLSSPAPDSSFTADISFSSSAWLRAVAQGWGDVGRG